MLYYLNKSNPKYDFLVKKCVSMSLVHQKSPIRRYYLPSNRG